MLFEFAKDIFIMLQTWYCQNLSNFWAYLCLFCVHDWQQLWITITYWLESSDTSLCITLWLTTIKYYNSVNLFDKIWDMTDLNKQMSSSWIYISIFSRLNMPCDILDNYYIVWGKSGWLTRYKIRIILDTVNCSLNWLSGIKKLLRFSQHQFPPTYSISVL